MSAALMQTFMKPYFHRVYFSGLCGKGAVWHLYRVMYDRSYTKHSGIGYDQGNSRSYGFCVGRKKYLS